MQFNNSNIMNNNLINCIIKKLCYGCKQKKDKDQLMEKYHQRWSIKMVIIRQKFIEMKNIPPNAHLWDVAFE